LLFGRSVEASEGSASTVAIAIKRKRVFEPYLNPITPVSEQHDSANVMRTRSLEFGLLHPRLCPQKSLKADTDHSKNKNIGMLTKKNSSASISLHKKPASRQSKRTKSRRSNSRSQMVTNGF